MNHPLDYECAKALQLWLTRLELGESGKPMGHITDKAIAELQAFRERLRES